MKLKILYLIFSYLFLNTLTAQQKQYERLSISKKVSICGIGENRIYNRFSDVTRNGISSRFYDIDRDFYTKKSRLYSFASFSSRSLKLGENLQSMDIKTDKKTIDSIAYNTLLGEFNTLGKIYLIEYLDYGWYQGKHPYLDMTTYEKTEEEKVNNLGEVVDTFNLHLINVTRHLFVDSVIYYFRCESRIPKRSKKAAKRAIWRDFRRLVRSVCIREKQEYKVINDK